jgi:hypothetical protein
MRWSEPRKRTTVPPPPLGAPHRLARSRFRRLGLGRWLHPQPQRDKDYCFEELSYRRGGDDRNIEFATVRKSMTARLIAWLLHVGGTRCNYSVLHRSLSSPHRSKLLSPFPHPQQIREQRLWAATGARTSSLSCGLVERRRRRGPAVG